MCAHVIFLLSPTPAVTGKLWMLHSEDYSMKRDHEIIFSYARVIFDGTARYSIWLSPVISSLLLSSIYWIAIMVLSGQRLVWFFLCLGHNLNASKSLNYSFCILSNSNWGKLSCQEKACKLLKDLLWHFVQHWYMSLDSLKNMKEEERTKCNLKSWEKHSLLAQSCIQTDREVKYASVGVAKVNNQFLKFSQLWRTMSIPFFDRKFQHLQKNILI